VLRTGPIPKVIRKPPLRVSERNTNTTRRTVAVISRWSFLGRGFWNDEALLRAGNWGIEQLLKYLPNVFVPDKTPSKKKDPKSKEREPEKVLLLTPAAYADAESAIAELMYARPVWLPRPDSAG